ncbi:PHP domain-containing protein [Candidatus Woesearchaeota archaeon]|nr:PHP domain-containing protein [Candidatus Woesearchaeota archaeon]
MKQKNKHFSDKHIKQQEEKKKGYEIDLHSHSTISDGTCTIPQLIDLAIKKGIKKLAITDHDTIDGLKKAQEYSAGKPIEIISGIELSCEEQENGFPDVHILGLCIDFQNKELQKRLKNILEQRKEQKMKMIKKLQALGFSITFKELEKMVGVSFGRPHIARLLMQKYPEKFKNVQDVFDQYLGEGKPAYVPRKDKLKVKEAITLIKKAGGISSLAHPGIYPEKKMIALMNYFAELGGDAIEVYYAYHIIHKETALDEKESKRKVSLAKKFVEKKGLLSTGGSDFHGTIRKVMIGESGLSRDLFEKLEKKVKKRKAMQGG